MNAGKEGIIINIILKIILIGRPGSIPCGLLRNITTQKLHFNVLGLGYGPGQYNKFPIQRRYPGTCSWVLHFCDNYGELCSYKSDKY
jgi:hypothetical protein